MTTLARTAIKARPMCLCANNHGGQVTPGVGAGALASLRRQAPASAVYGPFRSQDRYPQLNNSVKRGASAALARCPRSPTKGN